MKTFHIRFMYYTDERAEWKGEAVSSLVAIALAINAEKIREEWCSAPGFWIKVSAV